MVDLRAERERKGLSLDEVAARARIPMRYLAAIEQDDHAVLPPGPFLRGYRRQYMEFLGLDDGIEDAETDMVTRIPSMEDEPTEELSRPLARPTREVPALRLVVAGFLLTLVGVLVLRLTSAVMDRPEAVEPEPELAVATETPQQVSIRAVEPARLTVTVGGEPVLSDTLQVGKSVTYESLQPIAIEIKDLTQVVVHYDGERIEPLGNLSHPRRLVFEQGGGE